MDRSEHRPALRAVPSSPVDTVEGELVEQALRGDAGAWSQIYQSHFERLYRDVFFLVGDPAMAEELVQETFAAAMVSVERFDRRSSVLAWLRGIAHNLVRKHWRRHVRRGRAYDRLQRAPELDDVRSDPEADHLQERRAEILEALLAELPDTLREVFVLRDVQGLDVPEVAERLGITPGNVRVRANRARAQLREHLAALGWLDTEASA